MATLTGKIIDVTSRPPESISSITVKAPSVRVGGGADLIVSSPATVDFDRDTGDVTITGLTGGLSWLYIEGDGWSDTLALSAAEGMISLVEAIANASSAPGIIDYLRLLAEFRIRFDETAQDAVDEAAEGIKYVQPSLGTGSNVDTLSNGLYPVPSSTVATALGLPTGEPGELVTTWLDAGLRRRQTYYTDRVTPNLGMSVYRRWYYNGSWGSWKLEAQSFPTPLGSENLNDITTNGTYVQVSTTAGTKELNYPVTGDGAAGVATLRVVTASGFVEQIFTEFRRGKIHFRGRDVNGSWNDWTTLPSQTAPTPGGSEKPGLPVLDMEVTGKWTPNANGDAFLNELAAKHEMVSVEEIGRSLHDWPIYAAIIGDPTLPAVLVIAGQHGTEVGPPEGAWLWCRELTKQKTLALMDVCVIVVPMVNPDNRFVARGNKAAVDLNRDWLDLSQPETQAVAALFNEYNVVAGVDVHNFGYPRETSYQESAYGDATTQSLAVEIESVIATALAEDEQPHRRYGPEMADTSFSNAASVLYDVPSILIEIPCGGYGEWTFDVYTPAPSWQAHITQLTCDAVLEHVATNIDRYNREV